MRPEETMGVTPHGKQSIYSYPVIFSRIQPIINILLFSHHNLSIPNQIISQKYFFSCKKQNILQEGQGQRIKK